MNSDNWGRFTNSLLPPVVMKKKTTLPLDIILYMAGFLNFEDYRNFIRSFWPNNNECEMIKKKLWRKSTCLFSTNFLNGKKIDIVYNYDGERPEKDRILINVHSLSPIFGGITPRTMDSFVNIKTLHAFINRHVHMNLCSPDMRYSDCLCHLGDDESLAGRSSVKEELETCEYNCFHHYCVQHVKYWLDIHVALAIRYCRGRVAMGHRRI